MGVSTNLSVSVSQSVFMSGGQPVYLPTYTLLPQVFTLLSWLTYELKTHHILNPWQGVANNQEKRLHVLAEAGPHTIHKTFLLPYTSCWFYSRLQLITHVLHSRLFNKSEIWMSAGVWFRWEVLHLHTFVPPPGMAKSLCVLRGGAVLCSILQVLLLYKSFNARI